MATASKSYTFSAGTTIESAKVNTNFDDLVNFLNNSVVHVDGSKAMTGILTLPASDPTTANQATRKSYVDAQVAGVTTASIGAYPTSKIAYGSVSGTTNASGDIAFNHGLGSTPNVVHITRFATGTDVKWDLTVENVSTTQVNVRAYNTTTGANWGSIGVTFYWVAFLAK